MLRRDIALLSALTAALCGGCSVIDNFTDSDHGPGVQIEDDSPDAVAKKNDHGAASRGKISNKAAEKSVRKATAADNTDQSSQAQAKAAEPKTVETKTPEPYKDVNEEAALKNTEVPESELASARKNAENGVKDGPDESGKPEQQIAVDDETAREVSDLPDYATVSGRQSCPVSLGQSASDKASELTKALTSKLNVDKGAIYVAPTVIPDEYSDCVSDVSSVIASALSASGKFLVADPAKVQVAQNRGSATLIPRMVRECRRNGIPYLAVSVVHKIGGRVSITVRIIRADTGVTLTQSYRRL